ALLSPRAADRITDHPGSGTDRRYGAGGEEWQLRRCILIGGVPAMPQPNDLSRSLVALEGSFGTQARWPVSVHAAAPEQAPLSPARKPLSTKSGPRTRGSRPARI